MIHILGCNETIYAKKGTITSQNYPNDYPPSTICLYHIQAPSNNKIKLIFHMVDIEKDKKCSYDFLEVWEVRDSNFHLTDRICGNNHVHPIVSNDNNLFIKFQSDNVSQHQGFKLEFNHVPPKPGKSLSIK